MLNDHFRNSLLFIHESWASEFTKNLINIKPLQKLSNIDVLKHYKYLVYLDLSSNLLKELTVLSFLPYLQHLTVSFNSLSSILDYETRKYYQYLLLCCFLLLSVPYWLVGLALSNRQPIKRFRVWFPGRTAFGFFFQEILNSSPDYERCGFSRQCLGEHVKPSVRVVINFYGNRYWEGITLKYTEN